MVEGRDFYRGEILPEGESRRDGERPARTDREVSPRARYLAKAASLGQVVFEEDAAPPER